MVATVQGLTPCSNYSLQIGAGPFLYREDGGLSSSYSQPGREESLTTAINKIWASEENAFKAFAITAPVSKINHWNPSPATSQQWIFHQIVALTKCLTKCLEVKTSNSFNFIHLVSPVLTPCWVIEGLSVIKSVSNSNFTPRRDNSDVIYVEKFIQQTDIYKD